jgi:hypothetical protein
MDEARFELPGGWQDQTVHIFAVPASAGEGMGDGPQGAEFSLVIHRDTPQPGEDLAAYVERQLANVKATLPGVRILREGELTVGGLAAREAELRWEAEGAGLLRQRQVYVRRQGRVLTMTGTAPERLYAKHAGAMDALLASLRFQLTLVGAPPRGTPSA